ncbi:hypothetical protein ACV566_04420 [Staphylococcus aureus]
MQHDDYDPHAFQELLPVLTAHQAESDESQYFLGG